MTWLPKRRRSSPPLTARACQETQRQPAQAVHRLRSPRPPGASVSARYVAENRRYAPAVPRHADHIARGSEPRRLLAVGERPVGSPSSPSRRGNSCRPASSPGSRLAEGGHQFRHPPLLVFGLDLGRDRRVIKGGGGVLDGHELAGVVIVLHIGKRLHDLPVAGDETHPPADHVEAFRHRVDLDADLAGPSTERKLSGGLSAGGG